MEGGIEIPPSTFDYSYYERMWLGARDVPDASERIEPVAVGLSGSGVS